MMSAQRLPASLKEAMRWAALIEEVDFYEHDDSIIELVTGQRDQTAFSDWAASVLNRELDKARRVADGKAKVCRFAAVINEEGEYSIGGYDGYVGLSDVEILADLDRGHITGAECFGIVVLNLPAAAEVEAEVEP